MKVNYLEIKYKELEKIMENLLDVIDNYEFDLIIYVAKSGFLLADTLSNLTGIDFVEIKSERQYLTNKDDRLIKLISHLPNVAVKALKITERKLNFYDDNDERYLSYDKDEFEEKSPSKILIVDDVVDTGYTVEKIKEEISKVYEDSIVKVAVLSYFDDRNAKKPDFYLYENTVLSAPWTIDSKEYQAFIKKYNRYKNEKNNYTE